MLISFISLYSLLPIWYSSLVQLFAFLPFLDSGHEYLFALQDQEHRANSKEKSPMPHKCYTCFEFRGRQNPGGIVFNPNSANRQSLTAFTEGNFYSSRHTVNTPVFQDNFTYRQEYCVLYPALKL